MMWFVRLFFAFSCLWQAGGALGMPTDASLQGELQRIAAHRLFWGHQSVGVNLLLGLEDLVHEAGASLRIREVSLAQSVGPGEFGHGFLAENTQPLKKLQSFEEFMSKNAGALTVASMKFCYFDFTPQTDARALFDQYQRTLARVRSLNPQLRIVHVTTPLTVVERGFKAQVKRWIGRAPHGLLENARREAYNDLLRQAYGGKEPLFDLARTESTRADGSLLTVDWQGQAVAALVGEYSDDGQHLNAVGRRRAARAWVSVLAAALPP